MKRSFKSRVLCVTICMALAATATGCSGGGTQEQEGVPTVRYMLPTDPGADITSDTWAVKEWGSRTNTNIEIYPVARDSFPDKLSVELASNNLPDMINFWMDKNTYRDYSGSLFLALDDYKELIPNFLKWTEKYPEIVTEIQSVDDKKMYAFPLIQDFDIFYNGWAVRTDMLREAGYEIDDLKTLDDVKSAFLGLKEVHGKDYLTSTRLGFDFFSECTQIYFGINYFNVNNGVVLDNRKPSGTDEFVYAPMLPEYKEWVSFMNWMYENKILHPNFATMETQEYNAKFADGSFCIMMESPTTALALADPDDPDRPYKDYIDVIRPFEVCGETRKLPMMQRTGGSRGPVVISKESENKEAAIKAMDWLYGEEGHSIMTKGIEGEHWVADETFPAGFKVIGYQTQYQEKLLGAEAAAALPRDRQDLGIMNWWLSMVIPAFDRFAYQQKLPEETEQAMFISDIYDEFNEKGYTMEADPVISIPKDDRSRIAQIETPLETYLSENVMKFIMGQRPMSEWDAFLNELKEMNCDELVKAYNDNRIKSE